MESIQTQVTEGIAQNEAQPRSATPRLSKADRAFYHNVSSVLREARPAVIRLRHLQSNELRSSPAFNQAMQRHIVQYAAYEATINRRQNGLGPIVFALTGIPFLFLMNNSSEGGIIEIILRVLSFFLLSILIFLLLKRIPAFNLSEFFSRRIPDIHWRKIRRERDQPELTLDSQPNMYILNLPFILAVLYSWVFLDIYERIFPNQNEVATLFTNTWVWVCLSFVVFGVVVFFSTYIPRRHLNKKYPQTVICIRLLEALSLLEDYPETWKVALFKKEIVSKLEEAALRMEYDVPRQLRARDPATDAWLAHSYAGIARSIREQKKGILLQQPGARPALITYLTQELPQAAVGDLGNMARIEDPSPATRRQGILSKLGRLFESILKGGLPLLGLWLFQQSPYRIQSEWINTVFIGLIFYLIVSILREFDPTYTDKLGAVKDLVSFTSKG